MNHTLESYKVFPYIAWALVIGFALFTYALTMRLNQNLEDINIGIENLEQKLNALEEKQKRETAPQEKQQQ